MNFRKINNLTGWIIFVVASLVYILTAEKSGSFWDCGEFIGTGYKLPAIRTKPGFFCG